MSLGGTVNLDGKARALYSGIEREVAVLPNGWHYCVVEPGDYVIEILRLQYRWIVVVKKITEINHQCKDKVGYSSVMMQPSYYRRFICTDLDDFEKCVIIGDDGLRTAVVKAMKRTLGPYGRQKESQA